MDKNSNLHNAKRNKKDEFYTQLSDIESELRHYKGHFKNKVVFCNCDDPYESNFFKYFILNFNSLGLKKLITTGYSTSPVIGQEINLFENEIETPKIQPYAIIINKVDIGNNQINLTDVKSLLKIKKNTRRKLYGDEEYPAGDFRSKECIKFLQEADIICTNPPFSLFREYIAQLVEYDKKFLIIGNINSIQCKEIFPLIKNNCLWLGASIHSGDRKFYVPDNYPLEASGCGIDPNGHKFIKVKGVRWYTNLDYKQRHEDLILYKKYNSEEYPKFDNYDAINVNKTKDIPCDYDGVMGVPITFLDKYNPNQFEIIWRSGDIEWVMSKQCNFFTPPNEELAKKYRKMDNTWRIQNCYFVVDGIPKTCYGRIFIKRKSNSLESEENSNEN